ncbi:MAG: phage portal protein [Intestinibacter bartlettii]
MKIFNFVKKKVRNYVYAKMLNGNTPVFSSFGKDIYASDIVKACIRCKSNEISKLQPKHIRNVDEDKQEIVKSSINRLLKFSPNPLMTSKEFLEKITWLYESTFNCFIYPTYYLTDTSNGGKSKIFTGFYPLDPIASTFLEDEATGELFIEFTFRNSEKYTLPYKDIIHLRKDFSFNDLMGGNENGTRDDKGLLKILNVDNTLVEGLDKNVKAGLSINGMLKINTMLDEGKQAKEIQKFEEKLKTSNSGILPIDLKSDFIPINMTPTTINKDILSFLENRILNTLEVPLCIITGDYNDEQYQAYYEKTIEPFKKLLGQAFTRDLFNDREIDCGNEIIFYSQSLLFTNTKNKIAVADILGNRGALTDNQLLALFGYPPFEGEIFVICLLTL